MRNYSIIVGSSSFFDHKIDELDAEGEEFNDVVAASDANRQAGRKSVRVGSLIVRNNHYHGIVESAHARLGGLIEDVTTDDAVIYIHNPTAVLQRYIQREHEAGFCSLNVYREQRSALSKMSDAASKIKSIREQIVGQDRALLEVAKTLTYLSGVKRRKPYVLMLYGKSSLGKTETAKAIADTFFDGKMIERHLSMFEEYSMTNSDYLFGGRPNVNSIGYELNERESNLIFLDELDKCGRSYRSAFYSLFDSPVFIDTTYEVDIKDLLIIVTCNYLTEDEIRENLGDPIYFRIDKCIPFEDFRPEDSMAILRIEVKKQIELAVNKVNLNYDEVLRMAADRVFIKEANGRTIQAAVRSTIEDLLFARAL